MLKISNALQKKSKRNDTNFSKIETSFCSTQAAQAAGRRKKLTHKTEGRAGELRNTELTERGERGAGADQRNWNVHRNLRIA